MANDPKAAPKVREGLIFRPLDDDWVVYDPSGQQLHVLNRAAAVVWICCTGDLSVDDIVDTMQQAFDGNVELDRVERDVLATIEEFTKKGLLE